MGSQVTGGRPSPPPATRRDLRGVRGAVWGAVLQSVSVPGPQEEGMVQSGAREGLVRWLRVDSKLKRRLLVSACMSVCACACVYVRVHACVRMSMCLHVCTCMCVQVCACLCVHTALREQVFILLSVWDSSAKPQDPPGAKEARNPGPWALQRGPGWRPPLHHVTLERSLGGQVWPGRRAAAGRTHLTCRPSCCTPRAESSDTP